MGLMQHRALTDIDRCRHLGGDSGSAGSTLQTQSIIGWAGSGDTTSTASRAGNRWCVVRGAW
jgi:hypothetical protein